MKVCIVSDSHDRADVLARAVGEGKAAGAEAVIHCGDLIGAQTMFEKRAIGMVTFEFGGCNIDTRTYYKDFFYFFQSKNFYTMLR